MSSAILQVRQWLECPRLASQHWIGPVTYALSLPPAQRLASGTESPCPTRFQKRLGQPALRRTPSWESVLRR